MNKFMNKLIYKVKVLLNQAHSILTTGKSVSAGLGAGLTAVTMAVSAPAWLVALVAAATAVSTWKIPYKPFKLKDSPHSE